MTGETARPFFSDLSYVFVIQPLFHLLVHIPRPGGGGGGGGGDGRASKKGLLAVGVDKRFLPRPFSRQIETRHKNLLLLRIER